MVGMREQILEALEAIENDSDVKVLFACESGSRAWGFASMDSDYDVRFIYAHKPHWYLEIDQRRDVIEEQLAGDLDVSGWELRKALRLFRKCNPPLMEWLRSPMVYMSDPDFIERLSNIAWLPQDPNQTGWGFSPHRCFRHYYSMARGNIRNYFATDTVPLKKYLYVLRPILACQWIEQRLSMPPVPFGELMEAMVKDQGLRRALDDLVSLKQASTELGKGPKIGPIQEFIEQEFSRLAKLTGLPDREPDTAALNRLFVDTVGF